MPSTTTARRFSDAFAATRDHLAHPQGRRAGVNDWVKFARLVDGSSEIIDADARRPPVTAHVRNAIAHRPYQRRRYERGAEDPEQAARKIRNKRRGRSGTSRQV